MIHQEMTRVTQSKDLSLPDDPLDGTVLHDGRPSHLGAFGEGVGEPRRVDASVRLGVEPANDAIPCI